MTVIKLKRYDSFKHSIKEAVEKFKEVSRDEKIRIISHLDADGITACSILIHALNLENRRYSVSITQQLNSGFLSEISKEDYNCFFFTDIGSGKLEDIKNILHKKNVFILDHHEPEDADIKGNIVHVNPHFFGIDGTNEISGAGVVYLFENLK